MQPGHQHYSGNALKGSVDIIDHNSLMINSNSGIEHEIDRNII